MSSRVICPGGLDFISSRVAAINASGPTAGLSFCGRPCLRLLRRARGRAGIDASAGSIPSDSNRCIAGLWQSTMRNQAETASRPGVLDSLPRDALLDYSFLREYRSCSKEYV